MFTLSLWLNAAVHLVEHRIDGTLGDRPRQVNLARQRH